MKSVDITGFLCGECAMRRGLRACAALAILTIATWTAAAESPALEHVTDARKFGWLAIAPFMDNIEQSDPVKFPGLRAFAKDYRKARQGLDLDQPSAKWPPVDIDLLVTRNPNFCAPVSRSGLVIQVGCTRTRDFCSVPVRRLARSRCWRWLDRAGELPRWSAARLTRC